MRATHCNSFDRRINKIESSRSSARNFMDIDKESVKLTSVHLIEGCGKTLTKINDTIPHTRIDMGYRGTQNVPFHRYLYESECCPYCPYRLENFHIFNKGLAKNTFTICNAKRSKPNDSTNVRKSFYKQTTLTGVLQRLKYILTSLSNI